MFGNDTIDCEPEYTSNSDPDWSRVRPITTGQLENNINSWKEATNAALRKYRAIEDKRESFEKPRDLSDRPRSEGMKSRKVRKLRKRYNIAENPISGKFENKTTPRIQEEIRNNFVEKEEKLSSQNGITNKMGFRLKENNPITFLPSKINYKIYDSAITIVQKMSSDHWLIMDTLFKDIERNKGIDYQHLNKFIQEIFGSESQLIFSTIHTDPVRRIIKFGQLMLNVYHLSSSKTKLVKPGIHNRTFLQVYTKFESYRMTSQLCNNLNVKVLTGKSKEKYIIKLNKNKIIINMSQNNPINLEDDKSLWSCNDYNISSIFDNSLENDETLQEMSETFCEVSRHSIRHITEVADNDFYFLSNFYESNSSPSLEFSEKRSSSPSMADLKSGSDELENCPKILELNNKLENILLKKAETVEESDTEIFQDCEDLIITSNSSKDKDKNCR